MKCFYDEMYKSDSDFETNEGAETLFHNWFELEYACTCFGKQSCTFNLDPKQYFNEECRKIHDERLSLYFANIQDKIDPNVIVTSKCIVAGMINPFSGEEVSKYTLGTVVVIIDMLIVICFCVFIQFLEAAQKKYVNKFKDQTIEMTDFTIRVKHLPLDKQFGGDPEHLKAYLIRHFQSIIENG